MPETGPAPDGSDAWILAGLAARLAALNVHHGPLPGFRGMRIRACAGPVRETWLEGLRSLIGPDRPWLRLPPDMEAAKITGGLDLEATLAAQRPVMEPGLAERARGGVLVLPMAERWQTAAAAILAGACLTPADVFLVLLDESDDADDAQPPPSLLEHCSVSIDLHAIAWHAISHSSFETKAWAALPRRQGEAMPALEDEALEVMAAVSIAAGHTSMRPVFDMAALARLAALADGEDAVGVDHVQLAMTLVCGPISQQAQEASDDEMSDQPDDSQPEPPQPENPPHNDPAEQDDKPDTDARSLSLDDLRDMAVEALAHHGLDARLLDSARRPARALHGSAGKAGGKTRNAARGRPTGHVHRPPRDGARPDIVATLRQAAPWQKLRRRASEAGTRLIVQPSDFRWRRFQQPAETAAIFAVDASGSTALERLAEAKGALEHILAHCYVRRDHVALVAFRGQHGEILLPPTRSLVRAKRSLTGLPGGGPTPLADGMRQAIALADNARRRGQTPIVVLISDGRGNIALDGTADRKRARDDAEGLASRVAAMGLQSIFIDIAKRPRPDAAELARRMGADYHRMPAANSQTVSTIVKSRMDRSG